jgi:hypothetical protein
MRKHFDYVPCTVLLAASQLTEMLSAVDERLIKHRESKSGPLMRIGSESHDVGAVLRSRWHLFEFIKDLNLPLAVSNEDEELSSLDKLLQDNVDLPEKRYLYESNFYLIRVLMAIYEELEEKNRQDAFERDSEYEHDDWAPPENFADGTDNEQEIWQSHQANKEK